MPRAYQLTDPGRKRALNEDAALCDDALGLYVVCDGVGGHAKGEVASREATEQVLGFIRQAVPTLAMFRGDASVRHERDVRRVLESAVQNACYMLFGLAEQEPSQRGMATTLSALLVIDRTAFLAQVGDSRIYLVRGGRAAQLTEDHTLINAKIKKGLITAEQALTMKGKNVITRAVGHHDYVEVDLASLAIEDGDRFLLCSDGLHGYLRDGEIEQVLAGGQDDDAPRRFVALANERGGKDNITVVLVVP